MGRATFPKEPGQVIPESLTVVAEVELPLIGETWVIVEGEQLPQWRRGAHPVHFGSLEVLLVRMASEDAARMLCDSIMPVVWW